MYKFTADIACACRAAAEIESDLNCPDNVAKELLTGFHRAIISTMLTRKLARVAINWFSDGMFNYHFFRTLEFDWQLAKGFSNGTFQQLVILGAGLDSRAYRLPCLKGKTVFEVDLQENQQEKIARINKANIQPIGDVAYISCDFTQRTLASTLFASGYDSTIPTVFLWEGVCMYLSEAVVRGLIAEINVLTKGTGHLLFDYLDKDIIEKKFLNSAEERHSNYVKYNGEPYLFGLDPHSSIAYLDGLDLTVDNDVAGLDLYDKFKKSSDGEKLYLPRSHIVHAHFKGA